jgi:hypothetical protein
MATRRELVARVLSDLGFESADAALGEITLLSAASQLAQYEDECARFKRKYGTSLRAFEQRVRRQRQRESFTAEEDLMAWRFAHDGVDYWRPRVAGLRRAV